MMRDRPYGAELLAQARYDLTEMVVSGVSTKTRYRALMIAKAMDLAEQELNANFKLEDKLNDLLSKIVDSDATQAQLSGLLSACIRQGSFDNSNELFEFLRLVVAFKLTETNPLKAIEQIEGLTDQLLSNYDRR